MNISVNKIIRKIKKKLKEAMKMSDYLTLIAQKYGTDKTGSHYYTPHYHTHFSYLRNDKIRLLEIGIGGDEDPNQGGSSLRMWEEYFPKGEIHGLDICPKPGVAKGRIKTHQGSQADPIAITKILTSIGDNKFNIIIDDGSHRPEHVISTFHMLFQHLADDGWYVVEDMQTDYWPHFGGGTTKLDKNMSMMAFFKELVDSLNWQEVHRPAYNPTYFDMNIVGMHFYHNMLFIKKGRNFEGSNVLKDNKFPGL